MTVTSGFFNSINEDRKYDALQMAELFDGVIEDGVYMNIYHQFAVTAYDNFEIHVNTGRAWFNHTWIKNDSVYILNVDEPDLLYDRIDAAVIEVDHRTTVRNDFIKIVKGTPSAKPERPTLLKGPDVYQYPLGYMSVKTTASSITQADITNMVGTSECPFVVGAAKGMDIDILVAKMDAQWDQWYETNTTAYDRSWNKWYNSHTVQYNYDFYDWFSQMQALLDGNVAANLAAENLKLKNKLRTLAIDHVYHDTIDDTNADPILDSEGREIESTIPLCCSKNCDCRKENE